MTSLGIDRAYTNLLEHLNHPKPSISLDVVFSSVPYYLSHLALPHPTQLTAFFISSTLWKRPTLGQLKATIATFRTAVCLKHAGIQKSGKWFLQSPQQQLAEWMDAVLKGISRGNPQLKFAMLGGMLLAFHELGDDAISMWKRDRIQRQVVLACAELMETLSDTADPWEQEFSSTAGSQFQSRETMFLYLCYTVLPSLENEKLSALNVQKLARIARHGVERSFMSGQILSSATDSLKRENDKIVVQPGSPLVKTTELILSDQLYQDAAPLAKLLARCLSTLARQDSRSALETYKTVVERMEGTNLEVKRRWNDSILSTITSDDDIDDSSKQITTDIWKILKTLLFSQLMVLQTIIASLLFFKPSVFPRHISATTIARAILRSLHNQAFIISQFGGIAAMSDGFKELKRVAYSTIDIIDAESNSEQQMDLINHLLSSLQESHLPRNHPSYQAETAFTLTVVEQLIPKLTDEMIEGQIIPFAITHLDNVQHRDSFESAHSLILAIFASQAKKQQMNLDHSIDAESVPQLVDRLAPFYTDSLIKNSEEGRLTIDQLRLAYSNLIRAVSSGGNDVLTWFCITSLLSNIKSRPTTSSRMPLYLTLISLISCVPRSLLLKVLEEVKSNLEAVGSAASPERDEMTRAIQEEIMNRVDDLDKETVLRWWTEEIVSGASENA